MIQPSSPSNAEILAAIKLLSESQDERLERIEDQVKATNGRVTALEATNLLQAGRAQGAADVHASWRRRTTEVIAIGTFAATIAAGIVAILHS